MLYGRYHIHLLFDRFHQHHAMQDLTIENAEAISKPRKLSVTVVKLVDNFNLAPT